jgi:hypothetical protein
MEIAAAEATLDGPRRQKAAAEHRRDHYLSLAEVGSLPQETKQQELQRFGADFRTAAGIAQVVASILTVIPDAGAPTAMKFGGSQLGAAGRAVAEGLNAVAAFNDAMASRSGVEAANQRRDQDWRFQAEAARREIAQFDRQITAAEIRRDMALHALDVHERSVAQSEEMFEFFRDKFSSSEMYRLLRSSCGASTGWRSTTRWRWPVWPSGACGRSGRWRPPAVPSGSAARTGTPTPPACSPVSGCWSTCRRSSGSTSSPTGGRWRSSRASRWRSTRLRLWPRSG